jgi:hypothetical protein
MAKSEKKPDVAKAAAKPRKTAAKKPTSMAKVIPISVSQEKPVSHEKVAELAHHYWQERGGTHGHDEEDWFRAEQELRGKAS